MFCMRLWFREIMTAEDAENIWKCEPRKNCCLTWYSSEESIVLERISWALASIWTRFPSTAFTDASFSSSRCCSTWNLSRNVRQSVLGCVNMFVVCRLYCPVEVLRNGPIAWLALIPTFRSSVSSNRKPRLHANVLDQPLHF